MFANDGSELLDYEVEFEPLLEKAEIETDDDAGAVIFTENGKIYLAAFGLRTNRQDRVGRTIRFSFCQIFHETRMNLAMNAFCRIADEWESTGEAAGNLITETPAMRKDWQGKDKRGEDVRFENQKFVQWLMNKRANISAPEKGSMLKFFPDTGEVVSVENDSEDETGESYTYRWVIGLLLAGLVFVICVMVVYSAKGTAKIAGYTAQLAGVAIGSIGRGLEEAGRVIESIGRQNSPRQEGDREREWRA